MRKVVAVFAKQCPHCEAFLSNYTSLEVLRSISREKGVRFIALDLERSDVDRDLAYVFAFTTVEEHLLSLREGKWTARTPAIYELDSSLAGVRGFINPTERARLAVLSADAASKLYLRGRPGRRRRGAGGEAD